MLGRKLTQEQANEINGTFISPEIFINVVYDINDEPFLFLSEQSEEIIANLPFSYLLEITKEEYTPKPEVDVLGS
jgi:hypothetical protein